MRKVSFFKILYHDYAAFGTFSGIFIGIAALTYGLIADDSLMLTIGSIASFAAIVASSLRLSIIYKLFKSGVEVKAIITEKWYSRDRGRIEYSYPYQGETITAGWAIMKNKVNRQLQKDMEITILISPNKPKQSIILSVFEVK